MPCPLDRSLSDGRGRAAPTLTHARKHLAQKGVDMPLDALRVGQVLLGIGTVALATGIGLMTDNQMRDPDAKLLSRRLLNPS
jgi:hypothetical protein